MLQLQARLVNRPPPQVTEHDCQTSQLRFRSHHQDVACIPLQSIKPRTVRMICHSVDCVTASSLLSLHDGWTKFVTTTIARLPKCGEMLSDEVILRRCICPRRLCNNDDDNDDGVLCVFWPYFHSACAETARFHVSVKSHGIELAPATPNFLKDSNDSAIRRRFRSFFSLHKTNICHIFYLYRTC